MTTMRNSSFDIDRPVGEEGESEVRKLLGIGQVEVKRDGRALETGNFFIEFLNNDGVSPSGIELTTASHWALIADTGDLSTSATVIVPVSRIKELIRRNTYRIAQGPEGSLGYCIPIRGLVL